MNPSLITLAPVTALVSTKLVLAKNGLECSVITLAPGSETSLRDAQDVEERVLFVIEGEATVRFGDLNTILEKDESLLLSKRRRISSRPARIAGRRSCRWMCRRARWSRHKSSRSIAKLDNEAQRPALFRAGRFRVYAARVGAVASQP